MNRLATAFFLILLNFSIAHAEFNCGGYTGTCKKPKGSGSSGTGCIHETPQLDTKVIYCPYFQCDSKGNILMDNGSLKFPRTSINGNVRNIGKIISSGYVCYANCCYGNKGEFLGTFNQDAGCQNKCCDRLDDYLSGSCSDSKPKPKPTVIPIETAEPTPQPQPTGVPQPEPTPPDGIIEIPLPDDEIKFGGDF